MTDTQTCFPEVEFNEVLQDKIIKSVFDKLSTCADEKQLTDSINIILQEKSQQGLINLDSLKQGSDFQTRANLLLECSLSEATGLIDQNIQIDAAYVVSGITKFICNPPTFDFPSFDLSFKFSLKDLFIKLLFKFIDFLTQYLLQIIQQIINIILSICENGFESLVQGYQNINELLTTGFQEAVNAEIGQINSALNSIFKMFGFNADGTLIESSNFVSCESNIGAIRPVNQFLNDLSMMVTPFEICSLFEGRPSLQTLELIKELLQFEYPLLQTRLSDSIIITNFFTAIGRFIPPSICSGIRDTYADDYPYNCGTEFSDREQVKLNLLSKIGHSEQQARDILRRERERYSNRFKDLGSFIARLRTDPSKTFESIPANIFCKGGKAGMVSLSDIPSAVELTKTIVNGFYDPLKNVHYTDSLNIQDLYFTKQTQRKKVTRFATESNPVIIGGIKYINAETVKFKQIQALGNPIYYTKEQKYALVVEQSQPDITISFSSTIEKDIYFLVKEHFTSAGNYLNNIAEDNEDYSIDQITSVYNAIIKTENFSRLIHNLYMRKVVDKSSINIYDNSVSNNRITMDEIVGFFSEDLGVRDIPYPNDIVELLTSIRIDYGETRHITAPSPQPSSDRRFYPLIIDSDPPEDDKSLLYAQERNLENTLESYLQDALVTIIKHPDYEWEYNHTYTPRYNLTSYNRSETTLIDTPNLKFTYTLRHFNVVDDGYIDNRWLADINKINADNASEVEPTGILEEVQTSDLNAYQSLNSFSLATNYIYNNILKFESLNQNFIIDTNNPQDNSVLTIEKVYRQELPQLTTEQVNQFNQLLGSQYGIPDIQTINKKSILYENSTFTTGPFREVKNNIKSQLEILIPNPVENKSLQIQAFEKLIGNNTNEYVNEYYDMFYTLLNEVRTLSSPFSTKEIKDIILIIPFERILGINKVKNEMLTSYLSDPCAISQDIQSKNEIPLLNQYLVESAIKLLVRTFCLKNDLKDLLSFTKINPYTFVENDDTYIEFLLQTFKQDLKSLSVGDYFYNEVIKYIEKNIDQKLDLEGKLIDPISNQEINLDNELTIDFKIRFFIKQEYSNMLIRLENLFTDTDTQKQTNLNNIKNIMKNRIHSLYPISNEYDDLLLEYIFPVSKICSIVKINNIISMTTNYDASNNTYTTTLEMLKSMILAFINKELNYKDCNGEIPPFNLELPNITKEMIIQFLIRAPIEIVKGLAESFDPNIRIANPIRRLTETFTGNNLPCLPFSLALLPIGTVPFGIGPPILPPWGFTYLALDTAEYLLSPEEKRKRLKFALDMGKFNKLEDLFEQDENC